MFLPILNRKSKFSSILVRPENSDQIIFDTPNLKVLEI